MARHCPSCGRANDDDARFCSGGGAEIASACPSCGGTIAFAEWDQDTHATGTIYEMNSSGGDTQRLADPAMLPAYNPSW